MSNQLPETAASPAVGGSPFDRAVLLTAVASVTISLGMVIALLAEFQARFGFPDWGLGVITAASFLTAFIAYVWFSPFADKGYARVMMILGGLVVAGAMIWIGLATELWQFVTARALVGFGEGLLVPAARRVALGWSDRPGRELGYVFSASIAGFLVGPLLGAVIADLIGLSAPFYLAAAVILATLPFVGRMDAPPLPTTSTEGGLMVLLRSRLVIAGILLTAVEFFSFGALEAVWSVMLTDNGASTTFIGLSFALILAPLVVVAPLGGRLADRYHPLRVGLLAASALIPLMYLYGWVTALAGFVIVGALHAATSAVIAPSAAAAVARGSPEDRIAQGQGIMEAFGFLMAAFAAATAGWLYGALGATGLFTVIALSVGILIAIAFGVARAPLRGEVASHVSGS